MSPEPATTTVPVNVPATPQQVTTPNATSEDARVLQDASVAATGAPRLVCLADITTKSYARAYLAQVYGISTLAGFVDSRRGLVARILSTLPADRLILLLHSAGDQLLLGPSQEDVTLTELQGDLAKAGGKIGSLVFDGCTLGTMPSSLYTFAQSLGIREAMAWTHTHAIGVVPRTLTPPNATSLRPEAREELVRLAPWVPRGELGATFSADELQRDLLANGWIAPGYELFFAGLTDVDFNALLTTNSFDPARHFPRSRAVTEVCISLARAQALDDPLGILGEPKKRVVRPSPWD